MIKGGASLTGGRGSALGTISGALLLGFIDNGFNMMGISPHWRGVFTGLIIIVAVAIDALRNK